MVLPLVPLFLVLDFMYRQIGSTSWTLCGPPVCLQIKAFRNEHFGFSLNPLRFTSRQIVLCQGLSLMLYVQVYGYTDLFWAGLTNLVDRCYNGAVIDYIYIGLFQRGLRVNLADLVISYVVIYECHSNLLKCTAGFKE